MRVGASVQFDPPQGGAKILPFPVEHRSVRRKRMLLATILAVLAVTLLVAAARPVDARDLAAAREVQLLFPW